MVLFRVLLDVTSKNLTLGRQGLIRRGAEAETEG